MAKVRGPLMSFTAQGKVSGGALSFSTIGQTTVVKHYRSFPTRTPSPAQQQVRDEMHLVQSVWNQLHTQDREDWHQTKGTPRGYSRGFPGYGDREGYHLFLHRNHQYLHRSGIIRLSPFSHTFYWPPAPAVIAQAVIF